MKSLEALWTYLEGVNVAWPKGKTSGGAKPLVVCPGILLTSCRWEGEERLACLHVDSGDEFIPPVGWRKFFTCGYKWPADRRVWGGSFEAFYQWLWYQGEGWWS